MIRRVEYKVTVDGATETAKAFDGVKESEDRATSAADGLAKSLLDLERDAERARRAQQALRTEAAKLVDAEEAAARAAAGQSKSLLELEKESERARRARERLRTEAVRLVDAEEGVRRTTVAATRAQEKLNAEINAAAQPMNVAKVAAEGVGAGMTLIMRAAYLLPGFGFAGILLAIGEAAEWVYEQFEGMAGSTKAATLEIQYQAAMVRDHTELLKKQADAAREVARAMYEAGEAVVSQQGGISSMLGGRGVLAAAGLGGEAYEIESERKELKDRAAAMRKAGEQLIKDYNAASLDVEGTMAAPAIKAAMEARARAIEEEARTIKRIGDTLRDREVDLMREARRIMGTGDGIASRTAEAAKTARAEPKEREVSDDEVYSLIYGGRAGPKYVQPTPSMEPNLSNIPGGASVQVAEGMRQIQTEAVKTRDIMAEMWAGTKDAFGGMAESAMNVGGIVVQALSTMTGAVGSMMTNIIISGEAGAKGVAKAAGNALAGISAQAFGYSVLLGALAAAAQLTGPILGFAAPGLASAAGVMAAAGGGLAVTARLLGADKLGGGAAGRGGAGASPGGYGAATATNPYGGPGQQGTTVQVYIDGEQVTRAVRVREQRMALSGGIMGGA